MYDRLNKIGLGHYAYGETPYWNYTAELLRLWTEVDRLDPKKVSSSIGFIQYNYATFSASSSHPWL